MGREDYEGVVGGMRLASGLPWALPVCLAVDEAPKGDVVALADEEGRLLATLEVQEVFEYDKEREAEQCFRTTDAEHPGVARLYDQKPLYLGGRVTVFERVPPPYPGARARPRRDAGDVRRARLAPRRRLPDAQPDPPRARVPDEGRAGDGRRPARPPARRRHEVGRRAGGRARRVLPDAAQRLLPGGPRAALRLPGGDALRRARGRRSGTRSAARTTAARTSSSAATTPASATTTARTTRSSSSTTSSRTSSTSSRCSSSTRSGATSAGRWRARSRARTGPRTGCSSRGRPRRSATACSFIRSSARPSPATFPPTSA